MRVHKRLGFLTLAAMVAFLWAGLASAEAPRNVVLLIGDGMGFEQVKAASLYATGREHGLAFEAYYRARVTTHPLAREGQPPGATDSAAAATAIATGHKTLNGQLGMTPDGRELTTVLECLARRGKWTGLVTTVPITHATPAAFAAHSDGRYDTSKIADDYFERSRPNVLFGAYSANGEGVTETEARSAGYAVVRTRDELADFARRADGAADPPHVSGQFAAGQLPFESDGATHTAAPDVTYETAPHLTEMTRAALEILARGPDGFFLMVEGGAIDWGCHENRLDRTVGETVEFAKAFQAVLDWAAGRTDTLVLVTADHECGGLKVLRPAPQGQLPEVVWNAKGHTGAAVPLYALGPGAERFDGVVDNTDLFAVMAGEAPPPAGPLPEADAVNVGEAAVAP